MEYAVLTYYYTVWVGETSLLITLKGAWNRLLVKGQQILGNVYYTLITYINLHKLGMEEQGALVTQFDIL